MDQMRCKFVVLVSTYSYHCLKRLQMAMPPIEGPKRPSDKQHELWHGRAMMTHDRKTKVDNQQPAFLVSCATFWLQWDLRQRLKQSVTVQRPQGPQSVTGQSCHHLLSARQVGAMLCDRRSSLALSCRTAEAASSSPTNCHH